MSEGNAVSAAPTNAGQTSTPTPQAQGNTSGSNTPTPGMDKGGAQNKAPQTPTQNASEIFEIKVNGKMVKMTRQEALDNASMSYAANDRFNEAKKLRGQVDKIIHTAKTNPIEALMDPALGLTKQQVRDAFESWYHKEFIEPETLNEDQRKVREYEAKLKKYEDEELSKKKQAEQEEEHKLTNQQREYLQNQIVEALESSGLPKTKSIAARMAFYMRQNLMNGWDAPIQVIVKQVKSEHESMVRSLSQGASAEQLIGLLGDDVVNKIRQHDLKQLRERRNLPAASGSMPRAGTGVQSEKVYSSDVTKRLRDLRLGK